MLCPKCNAELRDEAKFCDACGAPVTTEAQIAVAKTAATKSSGVNWPVLIILILVVAFGGWLLFGKEGGNPAQNSMTNPHGEGTEAMSGSNPHAAAGGEMPEDMMGNITQAKATLENDPLNIEAINYLYSTYGQIGRQNQVAPYVDQALAELEQRKAELGDKAKDLVKQLATAALSGGDLDSAFKALHKANELDPADLALVRILGDMYSSVEKWQEAITWYEKYLAQGSEQDHVNFFSSHLGLGVAYAKTNDPAKSKAHLDQASALAANENERWQVEAEMAKLEGKEPPPPPAGMPTEGASPHGGMSSPQGEGGMPPSSGANPHGGDMSGS